MLIFKAEMLYKIPRCAEIQAILQTQWGGVRTFLFSLLLRLVCLMSLQLHTQNPSSMIKRGLNVTYHKPAFPYQVKTLSIVPEEVPVCSSRCFLFVRIYLAYIRCGIKCQFYQRED